MGRIPKRAFALAVSAILCLGCGKTEDSLPAAADASVYESPEELYDKALSEDVLIVYTVSTRAVDAKDSFEKAYPGLTVEIRDLRSPNLIDAVEEDHEKGLANCDVVICNDNSGDFKSRLVDTGIVLPYMPQDIGAHMKEGMAGEMITFLSEAELLLYNSARYDSCPIDNIWALTEQKYRGTIYMPNPLRSFSTYAFCGACMQHAEELAAAYEKYCGSPLEIPEGMNAAEVFWSRASENIVFTNSSDEVVEALGSGAADFGIGVSSKLRLKDLGYDMEAVYRLEPFCGCRTSVAVMLAADSPNVNSARLFVRWLLGEADGKGEGYKPFCTAGTWSAREDVADGNPVPLSEIDLIEPDQEKLISDREHMEAFWSGILRQNNQEK
ncbi:MAG: extracellular solute-binding protein [Lachnospiraceae bacterium]|nr:extracellular solute-binding protein [Lachnospiraceae bacterium]